MELKVMTYNIQSGKTNEPVQRRDYNLAAEVIKELGPDIVGLNEVGKQPSADFPAVDMKEEIAEYMGQQTSMYWYYAPAIKVMGYDYGNALLSKYPIKSAKTMIIPDPPRTEQGRYETRSVLVAELDVNGGIAVIVSHFGLEREEKVNAVKTVLSLLDTIKTPVLFMGDLNMKPDDTILQPLFERLRDTAGGSMEPYTYPSDDPGPEKPARKIDYLFASEHFTKKAVEVKKTLVSDHMPYVAYLEL